MIHYVENCIQTSSQVIYAAQGLPQPFRLNYFAGRNFLSYSAFALVMAWHGGPVVCS